MLIERLNDIEAAKVAMNLEKDGMEFYAAAALLARSRGIKEIFRQLAEEEKEHLEKIQRWQAELVEAGSGESFWESPEIDLYVSSLIRSGIFQGKVRETAASIRDDNEALDIGIAAEKDSILFYQEAAARCRSPEGGKMFARLVEEEKEHFRRLEARRRGTAGRPDGDISNKAGASGPA